MGSGLRRQPEYMQVVINRELEQIAPIQQAHGQGTGGFVEVYGSDDDEVGGDRKTCIGTERILGDNRVRVEHIYGLVFRCSRNCLHYIREVVFGLRKVEFIETNRKNRSQ